MGNLIEYKMLGSFDNLPTLEELKHILNKIEALSKECTSISDVENLWVKTVGANMYLPQIHKPEIFNDFPFYRVRRSVNRQENINSNRTFSYPPSERTNTGRCNIKGNPVFYTTKGKNTAFLESRSRESDELYFSEWEMRPQRPIVICSYLENSIKQNKPWAELIIKKDNEIFRKISEIHPNKIE